MWVSTGVGLQSVPCLNRPGSNSARLLRLDCKHPADCAELGIASNALAPARHLDAGPPVSVMTYTATHVVTVVTCIATHVVQWVHDIHSIL